VPDTFDEKIDRLSAASSSRDGKLRLKMIRAHRCILQKSAPTRSSGVLLKPAVPQNEFPIESPAFAPERCAKDLAIRAEALIHVSLQVMARYQFVMCDSVCEVRVVPRIDIIFCSCVIVDVGYETSIVSPPRKNGDCNWRSGDIISIRHDSRCELWYRDEVVLLDVLDRFHRL
jgi:hypothetical protein